MMTTTLLVAIATLLTIAFLALVLFERILGDGKRSDGANYPDAFISFSNPVLLRRSCTAHPRGGCLR